MAAITRQTDLLVQQDWKKIYQSFQNADFQSYDFETLRKSMIDYLRTYYPEDFNDFLESSEYVALIDLIAFLGQSLAFRADLNARENFIDTAERRDSVLKLARLISYSPKRNIAASGILKFDTVSTSETVYDSSGLNLAGIPIAWNDAGNENWQEQFAIVLNASFVNSQVVGKPGQTASIASVRTEEYSVNLLPNVIPAFKYQSNIEGTVMNFEIISATSAGQSYLYEKPPNPNKIFNLLYRNDNLGNNSNNTGWFAYFKQGSIGTQDFSISDSLPNRIISLNVDNVNNSDIWLFKVNSAGNASEKWTEVPSVAGSNVIYNTSTDRKIYQINTRANDQVDIVFGDGAFADIPIGTFRIFYRTSVGLTYKVTPDEMQSVTIPVVYVSRAGRAETLTIRASLHYTVNNGSARETVSEIKQKAPQQYYTQNRMISGEDYNILPFTKFDNILKIKATNRSSSGVSRYLDSIDVTGKYSSTNIFAEDGVLYRSETIEAQEYIPPTNGDIVNSLNDVINNGLLVDDFVPFSQLVYEKLPRYNTRDVQVNGLIFDAIWTQTTIGTNQSTGFFATSTNYRAATLANGLADPLKVGTSSSTAFRYVLVGTIVRFRAAADVSVTPYHFSANNEIVQGEPSLPGDRTYIYATVVHVVGDGTSNGLVSFNSEGPISLSSFIPSGAYVDQIIPKFYNAIPVDILRTTATLVNGKKNFGLRFDQDKKTWAVIQPQDLKLTQSSSLLLNNGVVNAEYTSLYAGDASASSLDSSWIMSFVSGNFGYGIYYRQLNYVFESKQETKFYFDPKVRVYDSKTATVINDQIKVLRSNPTPDSTISLYDDKTWFIYKMIIDPDGYENVNKILLKFPDANRDGVPDNPDLFAEIVNPDVNSLTKNVFFEKVYNGTNYVNYQVLNDNVVETAYPSQSAIVTIYNQYPNGQIFYAYAENLFYTLSVTVTGRVLTPTNGSPNGEQYLLLKGRQNLFFQYRHTSPSNRRIDPSPNNIIDLYVLTKQYAADYQAWVRDSTGTLAQPSLPTTEELQLQYGELENYKAMSDTLIYSSAKFKPLFGKKATSSLQATFKVVKNVNVVISDNDVKAAVISAINQYFDINNWDFGETFYFSELSAYLHQTLTPKISSIIIVPTSTGQAFGNLYQINAQPDEIVISAATVDNVEVISAITAAQLV
jgi:hypothetical protein